MYIAIIGPKAESKALMSSLDQDIYQLAFFDSIDEGAVTIASKTQVLLFDDTVDIPALSRLRDEMDGTLPHMICLHKSLPPKTLDQLYALGLDDIIPYDQAARLLGRKLEAVSRYFTRMGQLSIDYEFATKTAMEAMATSSELGQVMKFVERSYSVDECHALAKSMFITTDALGLKCVLSMEVDGETHFFSSNSEVKPLEQQLLKVAKNEIRFHDLGVRTVLNYPNASLLIKNMPMDDASRYGRIKDALPVLLGSLDAKVASLSTESLIRNQTEELVSAFDVIKYSFVHLNEVMSEKIHNGNKTMSSVLHDLSFKLPGMGLEEDQEEYILEKVETVMEDSTDLLVAEREMSEIFDSIRESLHQLVEKQNRLLGVLMSHKSQENAMQEAVEVQDIELF